MPCETCKKLFTTESLTENQYNGNHHRTISDLYAASLAHCQICEEIFQGFLQYYWDCFKPGNTLSTEIKTKTMIDEVGKIYAKKVESLEYVGFGRSKIRKNFVAYEIHADKKELCFNIRETYFNTSGKKKLHGETLNFYSFFTYTLSCGRKFHFIGGDYRLICYTEAEEFTMTSIHTLANRGNPTWRPSLARGWLQNCLQNHPKCTQTDKNWHPTRLLKISNPEFTTVQLILTAQNRPTSSYLTLSHCWGQLNFLKLTSNTLPQLLVGIRILTLPKTFQDAVQMAIFLGIEYIWIDSLCILQDSAEDWRVQSSQMGDVYSNGILNIAATASADGNGGLTIPRDPALNFPCEFQSGREGRLNGPWHLHPRTLADSKCLLDGPLLSVSSKHHSIYSCRH